MIRKHKRYTVEEVLPHVIFANSNERIKADFDGDEIKMSSMRLQCFSKHGVKCIKCGIEGKVFYKERSDSKLKIYHLNLYAINQDGEEVLMTKDHIKPFCKGGPTELDNLQTMCCNCNVEKGNKDE
jgi:5-methylcytosine-specific restriction endonuclease McrA